MPEDRSSTEQTFLTALAVPLVAGLVAWVVFLWTFPLLALWNGMYVGALLLAGLGVFVDLFGLPSILGALERGQRRLAIAGNIAFHLLIGIVAAALMAAPPAAFDRVPGSEELGERLLVAHDGGVYAATAGSVRFVTREGVGRGIGYGGALAWAGGWDERYGLWLLPEKQDSLWFRPDGHWERWPRATGWSQHGAVWRGHAYARVGGGLWTSPGPGADWRQIPLDGRVFDVSSERNGVWVAGSRVWFSEDGITFRDVTPAGYSARHPEVVAGYVFHGGLFQCSLWGPDGERICPVRDARVLAVGPDKVEGNELWMGSWGQGVWYSPDGGRHWVDYGGRGLEVRHLAVDWEQRRVWFSTGGMSFHTGIWTAPF
jgi:hypothetical protein